MARLKLSNWSSDTTPKSDNAYNTASRLPAAMAGTRIGNVTRRKTVRPPVAEQPGRFLRRRVGSQECGARGQQDIRVGGENQHQGRAEESPDRWKRSKPERRQQTLERAPRPE